MYMNHHPHQVVLLSSSFKDPNRRLFFTKARLYLDRIELSGWNLGKRFQQNIPLDRIDRIDWDPGAPEAPNAVFHLCGGNQVQLRLPEVERWKQSIELRMHWSAPGRYPIAPPSSSSTSRKDLPLQELITFTTSMG